MEPDKATALRAPFPPETIGKLPKPTAKENKKGRCDECGGWHGLPAVHLDYVGHAAVTSRLLEVDPDWTWEPFATTPEGLPLVTRDGLWIRLTIGGVTRPGFGDGTSIKEQIGDAIRNAAMRFGVALDLWAKEDLHATVPDVVERITPEDAERFAALLSKGEPAERRSNKADWMVRFGCPPADLPLARLAEADDFVSDLAAATSAEVPADG